MNPYQGRGPYGRDAGPDSAITKMERHYWITKQNVFKKMGKKEDECIIAADAELDAKLVLFKSIEDNCLDLQKIIDKYQDRICCLAQETNAMGRFLKEAGKTDKTRAGKIMTNVGKSLSYSGQQHLSLRTPLIRLLQEVETFRQRAISDTLSTLKAMEKQQTEYRAALSWMKDVSQELDPEKELDKFRKVQTQVRRSKVKFDKSKLDSLQKIDLLAAARCNMLSYALVHYHNSLVQYYEKSANNYQAVANSFKGYQQYDFCVIKELAEPSLKLAEQMQASESASDDPDAKKQEDKDIFLFFDPEYHDEVSKPEQKKEEDKTIADASIDTILTEPLLDLGGLSVGGGGGDASSSIKLLGDIFSDKESQEQWKKDWEEIFQEKESPSKSETPNKSFSELLSEEFGTGKDVKPTENSSFSFLHSNLLNQLDSGNNKSILSDLKPNVKSPEPPKENAIQNPSKAPKTAKDMSAWFNLFADLDPLSYPEALVGKTQDPDRNC
ncbi:UNVERIFIED_CONTAM: hypothetical protein PYX00_008604 [Menopon gallinae]|uniref:AH domain-containing protein n=1 Tax=Menopon gallinae TaxID=328185 RepID=A0AAW2HPH2_9NEOP